MAMIVRHTFPLMARCPVNDCVDYYTVTLEVDRMILVEDILKVAALFRDTKEYQENITSALAEEFACKVTTRGYHSGVETVVEVVP